MPAVPAAFPIPAAPIVDNGYRRFADQLPYGLLNGKERVMSVELRCGDLLPGCDYVAKAESHDELMRKVVQHAKSVHKISEITPELAAKVQGAIKTT